MVQHAVDICTTEYMLNKPESGQLDDNVTIRVPSCCDVPFRDVILHSQLGRTPFMGYTPEIIEKGLNILPRLCKT